MYQDGAVSMGVMALLVLVGCQQPGVGMSESMKQPVRPAALDRLDMFVGTWEGTAETRIPAVEGVQTSTGINTVSWEADGWLLVERLEVDMGVGGKLAGLGIWTWDPRAETYRFWWSDNFGIRSHGTATYDEESHTWLTKAKSYNTLTGRNSVNEGVAKMVADDMIEWEHTEWTAWKSRKLMEMKGTSRRR